MNAGRLCALKQTVGSVRKGINIARRFTRNGWCGVIAPSCCVRRPARRRKIRRLNDSAGTPARTLARVQPALPRKRAQFQRPRRRITREDDSVRSFLARARSREASVSLEMLLVAIPGVTAFDLDPRCTCALGHGAAGRRQDHRGVGRDKIPAGLGLACGRTPPAPRSGQRMLQAVGSRSLMPGASWTNPWSGHWGCNFLHAGLPRCIQLSVF